MIATAPTLFSEACEFSDELLTEFALLIVKNPQDRAGHATRLCNGDWAKSARLQRYAETADFIKLIVHVRTNMSDLEKTYTKEEFTLSVQDKMNSFDGELWLKTATFFAKLKGFITDAPTVAIQNNVIAIPAPQTENQWESASMAHQKALQDEARVINE